ncbi:MAG: tRNA (guanosine(37)-N1)-methyltransferase TrmD, partial [Nitrospinae bacterium]|nr:tRNA (guanosine(37)-N1)-methyltransferase TrmD [Nitrospinota bacterium]
RAREKGLLDIRVHDLRDFSLNKHRKVDDTPFGGGVGMVMNVEPIARALETIKKEVPKARTILLSPGGKPFNQEKAGQLAEEESLVLICGRYEGIDERVRLHFADEEISIGDYILTGGEIPAMVLVETVSRLIPGVLGDSESIVEESFTGGVLEYPQYTRPRDFKGFKVPDVLVSGDPKKIRAWQKAEALKKTENVRPDLFEKIKRDN